MMIGVQGFTIRDYVKTEADIAASLKKLHDIGYRALQVSAFGPIDPARLRELADENELRIVVTHTDPERILRDTREVIREHKIFGCRHVGIGMMPERYMGSMEGLAAFLEEYDRAARELQQSGLKLQYHNHFFEYEKLDGKLVIDLMAERTDPERWGFLLDLFWTQYSGRCPAAQLELLQGRVDVCHFKDMSMKGREQRTAPVMEGNLCWQEIISACEKTGVSYAMVEQDETYGKDPFGELKRSFDNLMAAGMQFEEMEKKR